MQIKKQEIGLFFGTFNPIHIGHLAIANYIVEFTDIRELWFVVTPQSPWKKKSNLLPDRQRQHMIELAIEKHYKFKVSDIEFKMPKPNYTINTLTWLIDKYPTKKFSLIIGGDNLQHFKKWKNWEKILENHKVYVYKRKEYIENVDNELLKFGEIEMLNAPIIEVSSSFIRDGVKNDKDLRFFVPPKTYKYIIDNNYFK